MATDTEDGLMSGGDKSKLDGIASGAEVNVQPDWNQATTTADDYIKNKPTITTPVQSDWAETDSDAIDFILNKPTIPTVPGNATTAAAGLMSSADKTKLDGIAAGANQDVQSDWDETDTADFAFIRNKPTIPTVPNVPSAPSGAGTVVDYNLQVATDGTATWQQDTGGGANSGEQNVQANWDETSTSSDAYIQNKPTIPDIPSAPSGEPDQREYNLRVATDGTASWQQDTGGGSNSGEDNVQSDWDETDNDSDAYIQNKPTDSEIGDKAFSNPPTDLTDSEKTAARSAIGAGTTTTVAGFGTEEVANVNLNSSGSYNWIATTTIAIPEGDWWILNMGYSADARWIIVHTDDIRAVTASSGTGGSSAGEYIEINGPGGRMRLGRDASNMLRVATQRSQDDPNPLRILRILPNSGSKHSPYRQHHPRGWLNGVSTGRIQPIH